MKISKLIFILIFLIYSHHQGIAAAERLYPRYSLSVSFDISKNSIQGTAIIERSGDEPFVIKPGDLNVLSITENGKPVEYEEKEGKLIIRGTKDVEILYESVFKGEEMHENAEKSLLSSQNIISSEGISLTEKWYPELEGITTFALRAVLPEKFVPISESDEINSVDKGKDKEYFFVFPHPIDNIHFLAGPYRILQDSYKGTELYAYFLPQDISLAKSYLENTKKYLLKYEKLLGPFPYKRLSIAQNFLAIDEIFPTVLIIGQRDARQKDVSEQIVIRGLLNQWFGNSVYVDYEHGNWSAGLVSYLSGCSIENNDKMIPRCRKNILVDYESYVSQKNDFPLREFKENIDAATSAIGDGKGAMFFHMLRNLIGDEAFYQSLKGMILKNRYQKISWDDLLTEFEQVSGEELKWFFDQWLSRKGVPSIEVYDPRGIFLKGIQTVSFEIIQKGEPFIFNLPLEIETNHGKVKTNIQIEKSRERFEIPVQGNPFSIAFDSNYDVMRSISQKEYPPVISKILGDEKRAVVATNEQRQQHESLMNNLKNNGFRLIDEEEITDEDIQSSSLILLSLDSPIIKRLFDSFDNPGKRAVLILKRNPMDTSKVIAIAHGNSHDDIETLLKAIAQFYDYSPLAFEIDTYIQQEKQETINGICIDLYEPVLVIQPQKARKIEEIIESIYKKPLIYIGERHGNYEDHKVQLQVIMGLHEKGQKFAIGMEMFQKPFQKALDDFISGKIDQREFLKNTQYFKRWQFDYNYYREILEYAKAKNIPVLAMNLWTEIIKKVSAGGIHSLTDIEKNEIPEDMDMTDQDYRERLQSIFKHHRNSEDRNFEYFYQSQILWDETMAHTIDAFLKKNPDYQMVVLAGAGHVMYGSGIPQRTYRLNKKDYTILMPDTGNLDADIGNFVFSPVPQSPPMTLKLGVVLKETDKGVKINQIVPGSIAKSAGMEKGDILVSLDEWKIEEIDDVKIFMSDKSRGEKVIIKVLRWGLLTGYREYELNAIL